MDVIRNVARINSSEGVRLVRGSHIVTRKLFDHDRCYFFQGTDGRIIFAIPYEQDFTLIGTTDKDHTAAPSEAKCTDEERDYLLAFASQYFAKPVTRDDVVWTYSGVRPLFDDGAKSAHRGDARLCAEGRGRRRQGPRCSTSSAASSPPIGGWRNRRWRRSSEEIGEKGEPAWTARLPSAGRRFQASTASMPR
jgi:hypothetical protein